ncbi:MAG: MFS transporter [Deltaproteobacteria bacterium]|nr:MFS transporter [Deltaproteobacteria bacterium]
MRRDTERLLTAPFLLSSAANFLQSLAFNLYLHLPGYLKELGAGEVGIGFVFSVTAATAIVSRPTVGRIMDAEGRRVVIVAGGMLNVLVCSLYLTIHDLGPWLYAVRIGHGIAESMLFAALFTQAADLVPAARRTEGIALYGVSGLLPISLGGLLGDVILTHAGYARLFQASIAFAAASLALSLPLRDHRPARDVTPARSFLASVTEGDLLPLWFIGFVFASAITATFTFLKTFVMETGLGSVGLFFSAYSGAGVLLRLAFGWVPERIGPKRALFPALTMLAAGFLVLAAAGSSIAVAVAGTLCGLGHGFTFPILSGLVVARARPAERGAALSLFTALFDGGVLVGGPAFGLVIRLAGYPAMFTTAAAVMLTGTIAFAVWDHRVEVAALATTRARET